LTCWRIGRLQAESDMAHIEAATLLADMDAQDGVDILRPFGVLVLHGGVLQPDEQEEEEEVLSSQIWKTSSEHQVLRTQARIAHQQP